MVTQKLIAVKTTGIFCRNPCPAPAPKPENVFLFDTIRDCLAAGFRACRRCRPLEPTDLRPDWLKPFLAFADSHPREPFVDSQLRAWGDAKIIRAWIRDHWNMTVDEFGWANRLRMAMGCSTVTRSSRIGISRKYGNRGLVDLHPADIADPAQVVFVNRVNTPIGPLLVAASDAGLMLVEFAETTRCETGLKRIQRRFRCRLTVGVHAHMLSIANELNEYFRGERTLFETPRAETGSEFQRAVWNRLEEIPVGDTVTYRELAATLNRPAAVRAVGRANGENGLAIVVPCHRVVGSKGELRGYGGGLWRKQWLLDHERNTGAAESFVRSEPSPQLIS